MAAERQGADAAERVRVLVGLLIVLACVAGAIAQRTKLLYDSDIWWHVRTGQWIWDHRSVPVADPFSFSFAGQPWIAKEWLSQIGYYAAYAVAQWNGVALLAVVAIGLAAMGLYAALSASLRPSLAAGATLLALYLASLTFFARPHLLTLVLAVAWAALLFGASFSGKAPRLAWLLIILLWANLHAAFTMGFVIAAFAFLDFLERNRSAGRGAVIRWVLFLALCPLVTLIHPYGYRAMLATWSVVGPNEAVQLVSEWQPFSPQRFMPQELALLGFLFLALASGLRLGAARSLLLVLLLHLFLTHIRYAFFLFPMMPLLAAPEIARQFPQLSAERWRRAPLEGPELAMARAFRPLSGIGAAAILLLGVLQAAVLPTAPPESIAASAAIRFAQSQGITGNVFNAYPFGGPLIFNGIPDFIDGRTDQLFLGGFTRRFKQGPADPAELAAALKQYDIAWTLLPPEDPRVALLDGLSGWRRAYADDFAVIHRRQESAAP